VSGDYLGLLASLQPGWIEFHPREADKSVYESVQEAATLGLARVLPDTSDGDMILFLEDDIIFGSGFAEMIASTRLADDAGFLTLYLPGHGYGGPTVNPDDFYGTQAVLFSRAGAADIVEHQAQMQAEILPGYDIRWSRWLARRGFRLYAATQSWVQHVGSQSRLHQGGSHASAVFRA
jgi:hypothetical protein